MPVGKTAKVRTREAARSLAQSLQQVAGVFGLVTRVIESDGSQPVGRCIGPALEARDVLAVLQNAPDAPSDLRDRALLLAANILELGGATAAGEGAALAAKTLASGEAWVKFQRICEAQGGMRTPPVAQHRHSILAPWAATVTAIDNRRLAKLAKLAGAPEAKAAGLELHVRLGSHVDKGQPLVTIHAEAPGDLDYALHYARANYDIVGLEHA